MVPSRPVIFISAVSKELGPLRGLLHRSFEQHFRVITQDINLSQNTGHGVRELLAKAVEEAGCVIHLTGHGFGGTATLPFPDHPGFQCSWTQFEYYHAHLLGKPVYALACSPSLSDHAFEETVDTLTVAEKQALQTAHAARVIRGKFDDTPFTQLHHPYRTLNNPHEHKDKEDLLTSAVRLCAELSALDPAFDRVKHLLKQQLEALTRIEGKLDQAISSNDEALTLLLKQNKQLLAAVRDLPAALAAAQQASPHADKATQLARAYESLDESLSLPPGTLEKDIPALAQKLLVGPDTSLMDKANAEFVLKNYPDAERIALLAKDAALAADSPVKDVISTLMLAGQSASEQTQYNRALAHYRAAAALTSMNRDVLEWASIQNEIGYLLGLDGQYDSQSTLIQRVRQACEKAGQQDSSVSLRSHHLWASALNDQGKYVDAEKEYRALLTIKARVLGPEHPDTLASRVNLAIAMSHQGRIEEAEQENRAVAAIQERDLGPEHPDTLISRMNIATDLYLQGKFAEAEQEYLNVLAIQKHVLGDEHPNTLLSRMNFASSLDSQGKHTEAEQEHRAVLAIRVRVFGPDHPCSLMSRINLSNALNSQGKHAEAEQEARAVLAIRERVRGPEHPHTLMSWNRFANALSSQGKHSEAEQQHRAILAIRGRNLGQEHPSTLQSMNDLALSLWHQKNHEEAERLYRTAMEIRNWSIGSEHPQFLQSHYSVATMLLFQDKYSEAEKEFRLLLPAQERVLGPEHPDTLDSRHNLCVSLDSQGKHAEAEIECRETIAIQTRVLSQDHPDILMSRSLLTEVLISQSKHVEAEQELSELLAIYTRVHGPEHPDTLNYKENLACSKYFQGQFNAAEKELRDVLEIMERVTSVQDPAFYHCLNNLSDCLYSLHKKDESLESARRSLIGTTMFLGEEHPYTLEALRLVAQADPESYDSAR